MIMPRFSRLRRRMPQVLSLPPVGEAGAPVVDNLPVAVAGANQTVTDLDDNGTELITLDASGSSDDNGIVSYDWTWDGGSSTGVTTQVTLPVGTTIVTLTVTDILGQQDTDDLSVGIRALSDPPLANAGVDQDVTDEDENGTELITLDGSASSDDVVIVSYDWTWDGGSASGVSPQVTLPVGTTTVTLTVTDGDGQQDTDTVDITVEEPITSVPIFGTETICCFDFTNPDFNTYRSGNIIQTIDSNDGNPVQITSNDLNWPVYSDQHHGIAMLVGSDSDVHCPGPGSLGYSADDPITYLMIVKLDSDTAGYLFDSNGSSVRTLVNTGSGDKLKGVMHGGSTMATNHVMEADTYYAIAMVGSSVDTAKFYWRKLAEGETTTEVVSGSVAGSAVPTLLYVLARQPSNYPFVDAGSMCFAMYSVIKTQVEIDAVFDHFYNAHVGNVVYSPMTSDTAPAPQVASSSSNYTDRAAWKAFNRNSNGSGSEWISWEVSGPHWIAIDLGVAKEVDGYNIQNHWYAADVQSANTWELQSSDNGTDWTTRDTVTGDTNNTADAWKGRRSITPVTARYWRLHVTAVNGPNQRVAVNELLLLSSGA